MKIEELFESISKSIEQSHDKNSAAYKSEQYYFAANAFKAFKKAGGDSAKFKEKLKDPRAKKAFDKMVETGKHFLSDDDRKKVGL